MKRTLILVSILLLLLLVANNVKAEVEDGYTVTVTASYLNLRIEPQGEPVVQVPRGTELTVVGQRAWNGSYPVDFNGQTLYAFGEYLVNESGNQLEASSHNEAEQTEQTTTTMKKKSTSPTYDWDGEVTGELHSDRNGRTYVIAFVISAERLTLRSEANWNSPSNGWIGHGAYVYIINPKINEYGYVLIRTANWELGYVSAQYLAPTPEAGGLDDIEYQYDEIQQYGEIIWRNIHVRKK